MSFSKFYPKFARVLTLVVLMTAAAGCKYHYVEKPDRLLSPDEMTDVICQLAYLKVLEEQGMFEMDSTFSRIGKNAFIEKLYKDYGINKEILEQNSEYYSENNREYVKIYTEAINRLNKLAGEEDKKEKDYRKALEATGWAMPQ